MSSLLSSYLIDPVVRQARRFSSPAPDRASPAPPLRSGSVSHVRNNATTSSLAHRSPLPAFLAELLRDNDVYETNDSSNATDDLSASASSRGRSVFVGLGGGGRSHVGALVESPRSQSPNSESLLDEQTTPVSSIGIENHLRSQDTQSSRYSGRTSMSTRTGGHRSQRNAGRATQGSLESTAETEGSNEEDGDVGKNPESLPADDGMRSLRQKIHKIWEMEGTAEEKARWMHMLMTKNYNTSHAHLIRSISPSSTVTHDPPGTPTTINSESFEELRASSGKSPSYSTITNETEQDYNLSPEDMMPTYCPQPERTEYDDDEDMEEEPVLGCEHYKRNVKIQCSDCNRWYTCRFCHDAMEDHALNRPKTRNMFCMLCRTPQSAAGQCRDCGEFAAWYYCEICKLWDNDSAKRIYHCPDCGICRKGEGLGKDFQHCKRCNVCISIRFADNHRCIEGATECDCPICGDYMFSSARSVVAMPCGHYMHSACHTKYMQTAYRCPICSRSAVNMELQWRKLDHAIDAQPMPAQFARSRVQLQCNDCSAKSVGRYHWLGNKCGVCDSYNTNELRVFEAGDELQPQAAAAVDETTTATMTSPGASDTTRIEAARRDDAVQQEMRDLSLAAPPSPLHAEAAPRSPPRALHADGVEQRVDSANTSPRRAVALRELRPSRSYFLNADDDDDDAAAAAAQGDSEGTWVAGGVFSPYEMLQRVSRSLSPIRYYLDGLGDDGVGEAGELEIDEEDDEEDEDEDEEDEDEDDEDSDISMGEENEAMDSEEEDDDEALDLPGHR
ncbi:hypothetical protein EV356DRAFT_558995 [Viridothelium virens]|uniref:Zf-CHY-domain-containing protein n=1 Tax=Viridothelium virens TaxID=1048519 RepID=A0A6A6HAE4_VIRVR|nr:hypothetical protein EV356DRAFT_558995 [Viridothelium virens]